MVKYMERLLKHVTEKLSDGRKNCTVFESKLAEQFPADTSCVDKRKKEIKEFAQKNGLEASISDPGLRVNFKKKNS